MNLLLISNSTMAGEPYLEYSKHEIAKFIEGKQNGFHTICGSGFQL